MAMNSEWRSRARKIPKGNLYDDFELGQVFSHHWGRTLNEGDNSLFTTLTLSFNPSISMRRMRVPTGIRGNSNQPDAGFSDCIRPVSGRSERSGRTFPRRRPTHVPSSSLPWRYTDCAQHRGRQAGGESRPGSGIVTWHTEGFLLEPDRLPARHPTGSKGSPPGGRLPPFQLGAEADSSAS